MMKSDAPIRVLIVDDHRVVRDGLKFFLSNHPDMEVVGECANGMQAVERCADLDPQVILMDLFMPIMDGVTATRLIRGRYPHMQVLALTSFQDQHLVKEAIQAGALGFFYKDADPNTLADAILSISHGLPSLSPLATRALMQDMTQPPGPGHDLTQREREVLRPMVSGASNNDIARELSLSLSTVGFHVGNILAKLGAANRTEAVSIALKYRLVPPE